ncbi:NAC domain-containing protein 78 [Platanthera guangdongensis]|uniref:NAC domain-containing protein 78 n=1 Tax=Platanthera guangdongensis TaxID=2320717 RepID=A0ABR2MMQ6_9ASPA
MISRGSRSKTPPPPPAAAPISTRLAPGFRFHPTDEELVSYYLRRKVAGQPLRVNAISEVDLYKTEPWDLPPQSVLRTRDLEWYFFTALDRKYSNRSRTNRATEEGYWKTTGKDRPVQRRSRRIGMKKTLVYHAGRAPRGQRTNWVMHEYRLEDDDLSHAGIPQDGYVLCRIFQKSGPGPQNGAQYGAPFEEEEWERDEEEEADIVPGNDALIGCEDFVHLSDFSENQDAGNQHSNEIPLVAKSVEQDTASMAENTSIPMDEIPKDMVSVEDFTANVDCPALQENIAILNGVREKSIVENQSSTQNNGYVQLNDIVDDESTCFTSDGHSNDCENLPTNPASSFIIDQTCADQHAMHVEPYGLPDDVPWVYASPQLAEANLMYFDALGHDVQYLETSFPNEDSLVPRAGFDFLEDLMAYYDATDDTLHYANADSFIPECAQVNPSHLAESSSSAESDCTSSLGAVSVQENAAKSASLLKTSNITSTTGGSGDKFSADCGTGIRNEIISRTKA